MDNKTVSTIYVALLPPYKIIKHGNKIGVQIGTQRVIIAGGNPFRTETHDYPVVAAENRIAALKENDYHLDGSCDGEVWDNVETKNVSVLCDAGVCLEWQQFIKILWHDHARLGDPRLPINKVFLFNKLVSYNKSMMLPSPELYTLHLYTEASAEGVPYVVRTERDDVFALNVKWSDNVVDIENRLLADLKEYLLILSPNRSTNLWHMHYETEEDRLRPLVERLNANPKATSFRKQIMASFTITALPPYEEKDAPIKPQNTQMEESVLDKIPANNWCYYYEGWRNGKKGGFIQEQGKYRFREMFRNKNGNLENVHNKEDEDPIVAIGIVAFWLIFKQGKELVLQKLTKYTFIPESMPEMFEIYTKERFDEFRKMNRDNPDTLDWDWDFEFYTNYIIPHELAFNKQSEALFDYISDSDIALVRAVMDRYIKYLKDIRTEKGYQAKEDTIETPLKTPQIPLAPKGFGQEEEEEKKEEEKWDDTFDFIFDEKINPREVKRVIETVKSDKIKDRRFYYVSFRILKVLKWIPIETLESDYLRWINCHFKCGWEKNKNQKKAFLFNLEGTVKDLDDLHPSEWKDDSLYGKLGKYYRLLAISFKNTFTLTIINGKSVYNSESYEHLKDRVEFLSGARDVHGLLWAPDEAYINDGNKA